jgi:hypothetical protein
MYREKIGLVSGEPVFIEADEDSVIVIPSSDQAEPSLVTERRDDSLEARSEQ